MKKCIKIPAKGCLWVMGHCYSLPSFLHFWVWYFYRQIINKKTSAVECEPSIATPVSGLFFRGRMGVLASLERVPGHGWAWFVPSGLSICQDICPTMSYSQNEQNRMIRPLNTIFKCCQPFTNSKSPGAGIFNIPQCNLQLSPMFML